MIEAVGSSSSTTSTTGARSPRPDATAWKSPEARRSLDGDATRNVSSAPADTLLWQPVLPLTNGEAQTLPFTLPASQNYRVLIIGHDANGRLGYREGNLLAK